MNRSLPHAFSERGQTFSASFAEKNVLRPEWSGTFVFLAGLLLAALLGQEERDSVTSTLHVQALAVGLGLAGSVALDFRRGLRNLIRTDLVCLSALYFLTYVEFLFPQPGFDEAAETYDVLGASRLVLIAMACMAISRHFSFRSMVHTMPPSGAGFTSKQWLWLLWIAAALGYLHMLLAVNFNIVEIIEQMMRPRFSQPWGRGKFGDWKALVYELSLFIYLIPPVYGILLAKRKQLPLAGFVAATLIALLTLFYGFSSGTRNVFATYVAGMIGAYLLVLPKLGLKQVLVAALLGGGLLYVSTKHMLAFRQIGLSHYLEHGIENSEEEDAAFFVDANLLNMALVMDAIPSRHDFTGWDIPYNALIRPIPRAIWSGKPEGLKVGIEEAAGVEGLTLSITFAGEAYMSAGVVGVVIAGIFFGTLCGFWNSLFRGRWDSFSRLVYAAGFFPAAISMRSLFSFSTAILPIFGLLAISAVLRRTQGQPAIQKRKRQRIPETLSQTKAGPQGGDPRPRSK